jgi:hypothetical protein
MVGSNSCSALGITISAPDAVVALAKRLVRDGWDPQLPMVIWRGSEPWRRVERIGHPNQVKLKGGGKSAF